MRQQLTFFVFLSAFLILMDVYAVGGLLSLSVETTNKKIILIVYVAISILAYFGTFKSIQLWRTDPLSRSYFMNFIMGFSFVLVVTKMVFISALAVQDVGRIIIGLVQWSISLFQTQPDNLSYIPARRAVITSAAIGLASIPFLSMLYGITRGKYRFTIEKLNLTFKDLPTAFDGLKIVQISDIHSGSWDDSNEVKKGIQMIQETNPDLIVFTGDLVNEFKDEINPYIPFFRELSAPMGKFAVLGNHDYYGSPRNQNERTEYWADFYEKYRAMGFDLILNQNRTLEKDGNAIKLIGVENWGAGRWFPKRGDLDKALEGCHDEDFCILLSHDPTHWDMKVLPHEKHIHLTLSGHTHGMQFGINLPGLRWSPIKYRYKRWIGRHEEAGQHLYINRGFGYLGFPGRVGMWPEITVIELSRMS
jgi:predicted MPP superfamily phosphohydrolase